MKKRVRMCPGRDFQNDVKISIPTPIKNIRNLLINDINSLILFHSIIKTSLSLTKHY